MKEPNFKEIAEKHHVLALEDLAKELGYWYHKGVADGKNPEPEQPRKLWMKFSESYESNWSFEDMSKIALKHFEEIVNKINLSYDTYYYRDELLKAMRESV